MSKEAVLIDINEFAERISVSRTKALEIARSRVLCDKGIAVCINPEGKNGGKRIYWEKYLEHIGACPAVPEDKRVKPKMKIV